MSVSRRDLMGAASAFAAIGAVGGQAWAAGEIGFPVKLVYNVLLTAVAIDKHDALPFVVDTSTNMGGVIDTATAEAMKLTKATPLTFGTFKRERYTAKDILIGGGLRATDQTLSAFPSRATDLAKGRIPATYGDPIKMDFEAGRITLIKNVIAESQGHESIGYKARETGALKESIPPQPIIECDLDGLPVRLRIDTANPGGVTLSSKFVRLKDLWNKYPGGFNGKTAFGSYRAVKAGQLKIGKYGFAAPIINLSDPNAPDRPATSAPDPTAAAAAPTTSRSNALPSPVPSDGTIGMEMLRRFTIVVDPRAGRVYMIANKFVGDGFHYDRAGVDIQDVEGALKVTDVAAGAAADKAGLKVGDKVTAWNGEGGYPGLMWALQGAPGDKIKIQVARDSGPAMIDVVLAERL